MSDKDNVNCKGKDFAALIKDLNRHLMLATGCTEPVAIAFAAASAAEALASAPKRINLYLSANIIKNAKGVGIPDCPYKGLEFIVALGALFGDAAKQADILAGLGSREKDEASAFAKSGAAVVSLAQTDADFYIKVEIEGDDNSTAVSVVEGSHLNLVSVSKNGKSVFRKDTVKSAAGKNHAAAKISLPELYAYITACESDFSLFKKAVSFNTAISEAGLKGKYGLNVGKSMRAEAQDDCMLPRIIEATCAAVDARMAGVDLAVMANSGSGNQGITATVSVATLANLLHKDEKTMLQAVAISNYTAIYIKQHLNVLSHLCGAVVASAGSAAGMCFLLGGDFKAMEHAANLVLGAAAGMFCDGAKSTCALKVATGLSAAFYGARLAISGENITEKLGIVSPYLDNTIANLAELEKKSSALMDMTILELVLKADACP